MKTVSLDDVWSRVFAAMDELLVEIVLPVTR
jgi:hypothetical protein